MKYYQVHSCLDLPRGSRQEIWRQDQPGTFPLGMLLAPLSFSQDRTSQPDTASKWKTEMHYETVKMFPQGMVVEECLRGRRSRENKVQSCL